MEELNTSSQKVAKALKYLHDIENTVEEAAKQEIIKEAKVLLEAALEAMAKAM